MRRFRDEIRIAIFDQLTDCNYDMENAVSEVSSIIEEIRQELPDFDEKEKINLELTVPIQLPPNGKRGDCEKIVREIEKSFNELGGGSRIYSAAGSWLDDENSVCSDQCLVVYAAIPIKNWYESIQVLRRLIRDEIQKKLYQKCVFLRVDNNTYGEPINLLGDEVESFPKRDEFGEIDPLCFNNLTENYESNEIQTLAIQLYNQNETILIDSVQDNVYAFGEKSIAVKGNITIIQKGMNPDDYKLLLQEKNDLEQKLEQLNREKDENKQKEIAKTATKLAEKMRQNVRVRFSANKLIQLGNTSKHIGELEIAEKQYTDALISFGLEGDRLREKSLIFVLIARLFGFIRSTRRGEAVALNNLGMIAETQGRYDEAERLFRESLAIKKEINDRIGVANTLHKLSQVLLLRGEIGEAERICFESEAVYSRMRHRQGNAYTLHVLARIAMIRGDIDEAERLYKESLKIKRKIHDINGEANTLNNLGGIAHERGEIDKAERLFRQSLLIKKEVGDLQGEVNSLNNLGAIAHERGDIDEAERLCKESLIIKRKIGDRKGEVSSLNNLGTIANERGNIDEAEQLYKEAQVIEEEIGLRIEEE